MTARKILGKIDRKRGNHAIAKLRNGQYAVGNLQVGRSAVGSDVFHDFNQAFEHWVKVMREIPVHDLQLSSAR